MSRGGSIPSDPKAKRSNLKGAKIMARKPMVTRTIQTTRCNVLCLNIVDGEPFNKEIILPRTYKDEKHLMKQVESVINTDEIGRASCRERV